MENISSPPNSSNDLSCLYHSSMPQPLQNADIYFEKTHTNCSGHVTNSSCPQRTPWFSPTISLDARWKINLLGLYSRLQSTSDAISSIRNRSAAKNSKDLNSQEKYFSLQGKYFSLQGKYFLLQGKYFSLQGKYFLLQGKYFSLQGITFFLSLQFITHTYCHHNCHITMNLKEEWKITEFFF